jgi:hypothetical protein
LHPAGLSNLQTYYDVTKRSPNVTFGGTVTLGMVENMIGLVEDADVIDYGNHLYYNAAR